MTSQFEHSARTAGSTPAIATNYANDGDVHLYCLYFNYIPQRIKYIPIMPEPHDISIVFNPTVIFPHGVIGNTTVFGTVVLGSSPGEGANT